MQPDYWNDATKHLRKSCPVMKTLITRYKGEGLRARGDGFYTLLRSVVGQQISVKAADSVWAKVEKTVKPLTPKKLLATPDEKLRACGLSGQKIVYARNVAMFFVERKIGLNSSSLKEGVSEKAADYWAQYSDAEVIEQLTSIKGIGTWTAEMFLIFHLLRPDVFPVKDLGVLKAIDLHYGDKTPKTAKNRPKPAQYQAMAERWAPYRTVATWYLWRALDPVPVEY